MHASRHHTTTADTSIMNDIDPAPSPRPSYRLPPRATDPDVAGPSYVIISGGTGANSIASAFGPSPAFVLPVSDDGGSSAEILRCFGGPSIGDIRASPARFGGCHHCLSRANAESRIPAESLDTSA